MYQQFPILLRRRQEITDTSLGGEPAGVILSGMDTDLIKQRFASLEPFLDERLRRLYAAAEAKALGYGGVSAVARATGVSRVPSPAASRNWVSQL